MRTLCPIDFAEMSVTNGRENESVLVLDLHNSGSDSRWTQQFTDLDEETIGLLANGSVVFLHFDTAVEAVERFQALTGQCAENGTGGLIGGKITLVMRPFDWSEGIETRSWDLGSDTRPVFAKGGWRDEIIVERL